MDRSAGPGLGHAIGQNRCPGIYVVQCNTRLVQGVSVAGAAAQGASATRPAMRIPRKSTTALPSRRRMRALHMPLHPSWGQHKAPREQPRLVRPSIWRLRSCKRMLCPSTGPLLHSKVSPALTAS